MVGDVGEAAPVDRLLSLEFVERRLQVLEVLAMFGDEGPKPLQVRPIELHESAVIEAARNQPQIRRTHRQEGQESQSGSKVNRGDSGVGRVIRIGAFEGVGLALAGPPLVLARQFRRTHLVQERHELVHEVLLVDVLAAVGALGRFAVESPAVEELIVDLELPGASVYPLVDLAEAVQVGVVECGVGVADGVVASELACRGSADDFLPEHAHAYAGGVYLGTERPLICQEVEEVAEQA